MTTRAQLIKVANPYKGKVFIGKVAENNDPLHCYRLQIQVAGVFDDIPTNQLPWAIPDHHEGLGETGAASRCNIPLIGALVYVSFQDGDPHFPVYGGNAVTVQQVASLFLTNYPNRYGWVDPKGNHFYVDMTTGDVEFLHKSGTKIHINPDGSATLHFVGPVTSDAPAWTHTGDVTIYGHLTTLP